MKKSDYFTRIECIRCGSDQVTHQNDNEELLCEDCSDEEYREILKTDKEERKIAKGDYLRDLQKDEK